jgi:hypothetical protein
MKRRRVRNARVRVVQILWAFRERSFHESVRRAGFGRGEYPRAR